MVDPDVYYSRFPEDNYYAFEYYASLARPEFFDEDVSYSSSNSSPAQRSISPTVLSETFYDDDPPANTEEPVNVPEVAQIKTITKKVRKKKKSACSHCKKPSTIRIHIHPETGLIVCRSCYLFVKKYGRDKKLVVEMCTNCKLNMGDKEHPVTADTLCRKCFVHLQSTGRDRTNFTYDLEKLSSTNAICQNCQNNKSSTNHPVTDIALCQTCLLYYKRKGQDRWDFKHDQPFRSYKLDPTHDTQNSSSVESSRDNSETQVDDLHFL